MPGLIAGIASAMNLAIVPALRSEFASDWVARASLQEATTATSQDVSQMSGDGAKIETDPERSEAESKDPALLP
jgi:hypothetical protein